MDKTTIGNVPVLTPGDVRKILYKMYASAIEKNVPLKALPSVMLWGQPGIGKSQAIHDLACDLELGLKKRCNVIDVRLILFNPIDLRGIPTANEDKTLAVWLKPKIFQMDESEDVINILFLDEISAAPQSVQAAAYQITLDRMVGEHKLPENCIVLAAGNRVTDKSVAYQMPKALANRLLHLEVAVDPDSWHNWAISKGIHEYILGFLRFKPDCLNTFNPQDNGIVFATPRSWELASNILNTVSSDFKDVFDLLAGILGKGLATELRTYTKVYSKLPNIEKIFKGEEIKVPKEPDVLYALESSMVAYAYHHRDDLDLIRNSILYANMLPADYSIVLLKDYLYLEKDYKQKLLKIPEFMKWLREKGRFLDAI